MSHLLFAGNVLIFAKSSHKTTLSIHETIKNFCLSSGMEINRKIQNMGSPVVSDNAKSNTLNTLQIRETNNLGTYLGYPLKSTYTPRDPVLDRISKRLHGWKRNLLSKAGRTQLINATTFNMSNHLMKTLVLPKSILSKIDRANKIFFLPQSRNPEASCN